MRRVQLYPLFEDYDGVHIGSVTKSQVNQLAKDSAAAARAWEYH